MSISDTASLIDRFDLLERRIAALNPKYRAFSHLAPMDRELLRRLDKERAAGRQRSAIHGLAVSVKGNIPVAGLPWTEGSAIFADRVAEHDAGIVAQVRAAGGVIVGTTTLSELAMYGVENPFEPMGLNPWDVERTAGGSSTGAGVAAALGLADINIGTDSGGSIRNPACHCGVVGFMPRIGALSLDGKANHTPSLSTVSLIARSVALVSRAFAALGGVSDAAEPSGRLLVPRALIDTMSDRATLRLFDDGLAPLQAAGVTFVERDIDGWLDAERAAGIISLCECGDALSRMDLTRASEGIRRRAAASAALTQADIAAARRTARAFKHAVQQALDDTGSDAIATPTWPFAAPPIRAETVVVNGRTVAIDPHRNCFVRAANAIDACALSLPLGLYPEERVPAGLHLMAPGGREHRLLAIAAIAEAALPRLPSPPAV
jgi:Asp-tRNA(Asn)/Glu-tRNA(Gln) amidotransferase A subunit family amidase